MGGNPHRTAGTERGARGSRRQAYRRTGCLLRRDQLSRLSLRRGGQIDDGNFSENQTLLITEWFAHTPRSVLSKNFGIPESHFANIPKSEKYIFRMPVPPPLSEVRAKLPSDPPTTTYTWHASSKKPNRYDGGSTMVIDVRDFPATRLSALIVELEPGAMSLSLTTRSKKESSNVKPRLKP